MQTIKILGQDAREPSITINGVPLSFAQSMTVRVAIESFSSSLMNDGLGDDAHGKEMVELYMARIRELRTLYMIGLNR